MIPERDNLQSSPSADSTSPSCSDASELIGRPVATKVGVRVVNDTVAEQNDQPCVQPSVLPVSAIIPTRNRSQILMRALASMAQQSQQPAEIVVVDGSDNDETRIAIENAIAGLKSQLVCERAKQLGAASQRNQGVELACEPYILFMDDDVILEPHCLARLWAALQSDPHCGGVNAMITNQSYRLPGRASRLLYLVMHGPESSYAGRVLGPAVNLLPSDDDRLPEIVSVDWLNLGATLYRRKALPSPPFADHFHGYSLMEDLTLSLTVGRNWRLANARTARIYHDSQPGEHKSDRAALAQMQLLNRHYVMTAILDRRRIGDFARLFLFEAFSFASELRTSVGRRQALSSLLGRARALCQIAFGKKH